MISFKRFLKEAGGAEPGILEVDSTPLEDARTFILNMKFDLDKELPNFDENYKKAQAKSRRGRTKRKDMPVITDADVKQFQKRLKDGKIDINSPFSKTTDKKDPFPEGLSGNDAKKFLQNGLRDGNNKDDVVQVKEIKKKVSDLIPIQKQIYFDKSIGTVIANGVKSSKSFLSSKSFFITSSDNFIIDGHHRFLSAMLIDPKMSVNTLSINLPIAKLLPMSLAFGDAIGNKRNK